MRDGRLISYFRHVGGHWVLRIGSWTFGFDPDLDRDWRPFSERYGTTRTWWLGSLRIVRWGHISVDGARTTTST